MYGLYPHTFVPILIPFSPIRNTYLLHLFFFFFALQLTRSLTILPSPSSPFALSQSQNNLPLTTSSIYHITYYIPQTQNSTRNTHCCAFYSYSSWQGTYRPSLLRSHTPAPPFPYVPTMDLSSQSTFRWTCRSSCMQLRIPSYRLR
ncbi:hypothetical protein F5Y11DRAFT_111638 [Daldinia sp. FL1419]|nr:hypothetical protein F5Y11DRAFT_111638 [Daldinia sp. FL1419]